MQAWQPSLLWGTEPIEILSPLQREKPSITTTVPPAMASAPGATIVPDLRYMNEQTHSDFIGIVLGAATPSRNDRFS